MARGSIGSRVRRIGIGRIGISLGVAAIVLLGAASLNWAWTMHRLDTGFLTWADRHRKTGGKIAFAGVHRGGWPFTASLTVTDLELAAPHPGLPESLTWNADRVVLRVTFSAPATLQLDAEGAQRLHVWEGLDFQFTADRLHASLPLTRIEAPGQVEFEARNLRASILLESDSFGTLTVAGLTARVELTAAEGSDAATARFSMGAAMVGLPPQLRWPLGPSIESLTVEGAIDGPLPRESGLAANAAAWRDGGGSAEIQKLAFVWGPLVVDASATLALDEQLQPMGAGSGKLIGYDAALDALSSNGVLSRSAVTAAKAVLSLLADTPTEGEASEVEVPMTLQHRTLSMRQIPLLRLPEIDWPKK